MSADAELIQNIKAHFARKTSAQLRDILQSNDLNSWSPEAFSAATEILADRASGLADEPSSPEPERLPPTGPNGETLAAVFAFALFGVPGLAAMVALGYKPRFPSTSDTPPEFDEPIPFGSNMAWLAINSKDTEAVAAAMPTEEGHFATWKDGLAAVNERSLFVTPPLADWTLIVGKLLFPPTEIEPFVRSLLEYLSGKFDDVQYYCNEPGVELHIWARARKGRLIRGYAWLGEKKQTIWEFGDPTKEERDLALDTLPPKIEHSDDRAGRVEIIPDQQTVFQVAYLWSIDPSSLTNEYKEPVWGILIRAPRT